MKPRILPPSTLLSLLFASCASTLPGTNFSGADPSLARPDYFNAHPRGQVTGEKAQSGSETGEASLEISHTFLSIGRREFLDDSFWPNHDLDQQVSFGFISDTYIPGKIGSEFRVISSTESTNIGGTSHSMSTVDFSIGARKTWGAADDYFHPYLGAGIAILNSRLENDDGLHLSDIGVGAYAHAGAYFQVKDNLALGIDYRFLDGSDMILRDFEESDLDFTAFSFIISFSQ